MAGRTLSSRSFTNWWERQESWTNELPSQSPAIYTRKMSKRSRNMDEKAKPSSVPVNIPDKWSETSEKHPTKGWITLSLTPSSISRCRKNEDEGKVVGKSEKKKKSRWVLAEI